MRHERVFVTGGAGFIGSRLLKALDAAGASALAYDSLIEQVHGPAANPPLAAPLVRADIRDSDALAQALAEFEPTIVVHLAAETGTGQSADEPVRYADVNVVGTARLIEAMKALPRPPRRVVLAATRAVYGEGAYRQADGRLVVPPPRRPADLSQGRFDPTDEQGRPLEPVPTPETVAPVPGSVYGSTKLMQEYLLQQTPAPWDHVILRLQNVYGPGQSLRNPYTGVLSIFCQQAMAGRTLNIFEDGRIYRDFVFVDDVVRAFMRACESPVAGGQVINIGTARRAAIADVAALILARLGLPAGRCRTSGDFRAGDIRHAVADTTRAAALLEWHPEVEIEQGVAALVDWARASPA
ncbi:MAG: NAD-dependent epimerase/dehydratase family protein [Rubrivivax sp.]|nr:NAD-dependent epimerase/dehydratase family protein [Rubrivivax sp.]